MTLGAGLARTVLPKGFLAGGINCGVRRYRPDLGVIISEVPAVAAGCFTQNECKAAPVLHCQKHLPSAEIRAIITNSGQANAATGPEGIYANTEMVMAMAKELFCLPRQILTASTGMIGPQLDLAKILPAIPELVERAQTAAEAFAVAILTTDLVPKTVTTELRLSGGIVRITGICKGSGMIHPNMATMLGYLLTDAAVAPPLAQSLLKEVTDQTFNMISVDGDTSTNDSVFLMANGATGVPVVSAEDVKLFKEALVEVAETLAQSIAIDGEGATKLVAVTVQGAPDLATARKAARGLTLSPLVKTALHGEDPNWGRILARLGADGVGGSALSRMELRIQGRMLFISGRPALFNRQEVKALLRENRIEIDIDLKSGDAAATAWGCDLSKKYVDINAEYGT